jgi:hypothetical protein
MGFAGFVKSGDSMLRDQSTARKSGVSGAHLVVCPEEGVFGERAHHAPTCVPQRTGDRRAESAGDGPE